MFAWDAGTGATRLLANAADFTGSADVPAAGRTGVFTASMPGLVLDDVGDVRQSDVFVAGPLR